MLNILTTKNSVRNRTCQMYNLFIRDKSVMKFAHFIRVIKEHDQTPKIQIK